MSNTKAIRKIVVKEVNWVGDTVLTTPTLHALRQNFPQATITVIARPWVAGLLEDNPDINHLWVENDQPSLNNLLNYLRLIRKIHKQRFDVGVALPNSFSAAFLLAAGRVKQRVGYDRDGRHLLLTEPIKVEPAILRTHQIEYYLNIIKPICDVNQVERKLVLRTNSVAHQEIEAILLQEGIKPTNLLIGLNPGAYYGSAKRWLPERYAKVADYVIQKYNAQVVITGTNSETPVAAAVLDCMKEKAYNFAGRITLKQLIALIEEFSLFITNDSGAMHIAAALQVPIVAIFGSTDWVTTAPYSDKAVIVRKDTDCAPCLLRECPTDHRCMTAIQVEDVISVIDAQIKKYVENLS